MYNGSAYITYWQWAVSESFLTIPVDNFVNIHQIYNSILSNFYPILPNAHTHACTQTCINTIFSQLLTNFPSPRQHRKDTSLPYLHAGSSTVRCTCATVWSLNLFFPKYKSWHWIKKYMYPSWIHHSPSPSLKSWSQKKSLGRVKAGPPWGYFSHLWS